MNSTGNITPEKSTGGNFRIRPFRKTEAEYEAIVALDKLVWPDTGDAVADWQYRDEHRAPGRLYQRLVVEQDGQIIAFGAYQEPHWTYEPGKFFFDCRVHPHYLNQGVASAFYHYVLGNIVARGAKIMTALTREDQPQAIQFLTDYGFEQVMRSPSSFVDVAAFDMAPFQGVLDQVAADGIEIYSVAELQKMDVDWMRKLWQLECAIDEDIPLPAPPTHGSLQRYEEVYLNDPSFDPKAWVVAVDRGKYVALSALWRDLANAEQLYTHVTGVVRSHRRRGLAMALKLHGILFAKQYGAKKIWTENEEHNPMFKLNLRLGFQPAPAWLDFRRELTEFTAEDEEAYDAVTERPASAMNGHPVVAEHELVIGDD
ncbi:MAG: GNAT family N-acetyltransferase [Caldilineaceae bacterium]|nr:GNAT family N-acetyltransferase [Caldilineaceae bacterium]